ncbi:hypothetical protein ACW9HQ_44495, partial [Nocardia gipuzkoensis]
MSGYARGRLYSATTALDQPDPAGDWGYRICAACVACLDGVDAVAVSLRASLHSFEIFGGSSEWAIGLEDAQFGLGEGPVADAFTTGEPVESTRAGTDPRWPLFSR